jgi:beta-xylosidase
MLLVFTIEARPVFAWTSDNGDGTFTNPVLYGDFPDPDIIRVGEDYYLATTTFVSIPGIEILHSKDLVNWEIVGYALKRIDADPKYDMIGGTEYANGAWAPSLRYHNGTFYILDNIQAIGSMIFRAKNPAGPWTANKLNDYLYDPGLMFDDDGTPLVYHGAGGNIQVAVLSSDLTKVLSSSPAFRLPNGGEGSHAHKINGKYFVFNSTYGMYPALLCSRSDNRNGPFTTITVCNNHVPWGGPHQGGIVDLPNGDWWGFSLTDSGAIGRDLWLGPVAWKDGWPYFGDPSAPSIPTRNVKPRLGKFPITHLPSSDEFSSPRLGLQWEWSHNPDDSKWSLTERPGFLRLHTQSGANLADARNTLTQRTMGPICSGIVKLDTSHMQPGDRAGLTVFEPAYGYIAVYKDTDSQRIVGILNKNGSLKTPSEDILATVPNVSGVAIWLKVSCDFRSPSKAQFAYSTDGVNFKPLEVDMPLHFSLDTFQGDRFGIFNYNPQGSAGWLDVDYFHMVSE